MPPVATSPRRMEALARALDRAVASAVVPGPRIDQLRSAFMATDAQGGSWTIDPEFQRWGRLDGERWMVDDPPPQLFMDSELRASLEALEAMAARAIVTGADALHAPRTHWFRTPVGPGEPPSMQASRSSREPDTAPRPPLDREQAQVTVPARSTESMSPRASAPPETPPARSATEDLVVEPVRMASPMSSKVSGTAEPATRDSEEIPPAPKPMPLATVMSSEASGQTEPTARASVEITPAPAPVPMPVMTPTRKSSMTGERAASAAAHDAAPVEETVPSRSVTPEAHRRFAGPDIAPVTDDPATPASTAINATPAPDRTPASAESPASVPPRDVRHNVERWVPTSIAPRLKDERREARDDRAHVVLCGLLATLFLVLAVWKVDGLGYAAAVLFGLLTVTLLVLNLVQSRRD